MQTTIFGGGSDLGVHINGSSLGPKTILKNYQKKYVLLEQDKNIKKSLKKDDLKKNLSSLNEFNTKLYQEIEKENNYSIMVGGDHSTSIASGLASLKKNPHLGIIWIDAHLDYNTFKSTITGNLHGLPLASLNGLNQDLSKFHDGPYFDPKKTVVVGYRSLEKNANLEIENIKTMGVTVFTTNDLKENSITKIMNLAFKIATDNYQNDLHISFDLDVIDPIIAPGVSIPEINGLNEQEVFEITNYLTTKKDYIKSFDLVEYNPLNDINDKTLKIAQNILNKMVK